MKLRPKLLCAGMLAALVLAPGDFAAVKRQYQLLGDVPAPDEFIEQLGREHAVKPDVRHARHYLRSYALDPRAVKPGSHGLLGIQFRVEALGGTVRIVSAPGQGTRVEARLPAVLQEHAPVSDPAADASS